MNFQDYFDYIIEHANRDEIPERFYILLNSEPSQKQLNYAQYLMDENIKAMISYGVSFKKINHDDSIVGVWGIISDFNTTENFLDSLESKSQLVISEIISILLNGGALIDYIAIYNECNQKNQLVSTCSVLPDDIVCVPMTVREHMTHMGYDDDDFREKPTENQINYLRMLLNEKYYRYFSLYSSEEGRFGELKNYTNLFKDFPKSSDTDDYMIQHFSKCEFSKMIDFVKGRYYISDYRHAFKQK